MKRISLFLLYLFFCGAHLYAEDEGILLQFKYSKDDAYRILSTVNEVVKVNGRVHHKAEILNRIAVQVSNVDGKGRGFNEATFMTSESSVTNNAARFVWGDEYESKFWRDKSGIYEIPDKYFMPVVRDVPNFPDKPVKIGDTWTASGHEAHDLRRSFAIEKPFKVPFAATYKYEKDEKGLSSDGSNTEKTFQVISVNYKLYFENPIPAEVLSDYPVSTMGFSNQTLWWDNEKGQIDHYSENFRILIETTLGNQLDFVGTAHAEVTDFKRTGTEENLKLVQEKVESLGLQNISVTKSEKGLTISLENIQFKADSAILQESEKIKIQGIAKILSEYPNDLLVSGHTALAGTEKERQELSEERADAVAQYLIKLGVRDQYHIFTQGFGAKVPIAPNNTEAGKAKNRRVEITILDK